MIEGFLFFTVWIVIWVLGGEGSVCFSAKTKFLKTVTKYDVI